MDRRKPELLSPAGDMEKLRMAVAYGADAVYLAGTSFGMRSFTGNFTPDELPKAVQLAHAAGVKVHCTVNIMPRNDEAAALPAYLEQLDAAGVDALILADLGAFTLAGKYAPRCERHISTQQSIANYVCAQSWFDLGAQPRGARAGAEPAGDPRRSASGSRPSWSSRPSATAQCASPIPAAACSATI